MSTVETHNPWASGSAGGPSTSTSMSPTRKTSAASATPLKERTVIVIDDDSDADRDSDSGSDTEQSAVEAHLLRDNGSNKSSGKGSRETNGNMKMDVDFLAGTDSRDAKTPTTTHEPPTSPSVSPKGWTSSHASPSRGGGSHTPMAIPTALPVPPPLHGSGHPAAQPLFTTQPLPLPSQQGNYVPPLLSQPNASQPTGSQPTTAQVPPPKAKESPKPPPKPLQQPTIRLEFYVDDPEMYEVDILSMAKAGGMRLPTPPPPDKESSDSEEDDEKEKDGPDGLLGGHIPAGGALAAAMAQAAGGGTAEVAMDAPVPKRRKRRNRDYDLDDPFIDDIDLAIDERRYIAQTTLQGFYVSAGDVSLVEQEAASNADTNQINPFTSQPYPNNGNHPHGVKNLDLHGNKGLDGGVKRGPGRPPKRAAGPVNAVLIAKTLLSKPLGKKGDEDVGHIGVVTAASTLEMNPSGHNETGGLQVNTNIDGFGTQDSPIMLHDESKHEREGSSGPSAGGQKRKRESTPPTDDPNKKRKLAKILPFPPELEAQLDVLQKAIAKHDFANKGKFPPDLKPILLATAILAITVQGYDENLFNYLPKIFPYNRFTMLKLTKRLAYKDHIRLIHERQAALLAELAKMVDEGMDTAKVEYERSLQLWEERKARKKWEEEKRAEGAAGMEGVEFQSAPNAPNAPNATVPKEADKDDKEEKEGEEGDGDEDKDKPPQTRYRLNETMRGYLWALVQLSNDVCTLTNEKNHLEGSKDLVSDQSQRKELYKKIMQAFPDGWMNTGTISREVSMMKKKMESAVPKTEDAANPATGVPVLAPAATGPAPIAPAP